MQCTFVPKRSAINNMSIHKYLYTGKPFYNVILTEQLGLNQGNK